MCVSPIYNHLIHHIGYTVPVKSNGTIVTCTKMADCTPSKKVIRNRPGEYLLAHLVS